MNNDIIYEVIKYVEQPTHLRKIRYALLSKEHFSRQLRHTAEVLEKKLKNRLALTYLLENNIYKDCNYKFDVTRIHELLSELLKKDKLKDKNKIAPSLARKAKQLDFGLRKKILLHKLDPELRRDHRPG